MKKLIIITLIPFANAITWDKASNAFIQHPTFQKHIPKPFVLLDIPHPYKTYTVLYACKAHECNTTTSVWLHTTKGAVYGKVQQRYVGNPSRAIQHELDALQK